MKIGKYNIIKSIFIALFIIALIIPNWYIGNLLYILTNKLYETMIVMMILCSTSGFFLRDYIIKFTNYIIKVCDNLPNKLKR